MHGMMRGLLLAEEELPKLLAQPEKWQSLDINYEEPRVERVWHQWGEIRICLHRIHPVKTMPFFHPHPWPSAMRILSGKYAMSVGYGVGHEEPPTAVQLILAPGSTYEMSEPNGWHSVQPISEPVMSLMVTGKPWGREMPKSDKIKLSSLNEDVVEEIMNFFKKEYPT